MQKQRKKQRKKRSLKAEITERLFKCGCGRLYTANASLWTHQKDKHNRTKPPGSSNLN